MKNYFLVMICKKDKYVRRFCYDGYVKQNEMKCSAIFDKGVKMQQLSFNSDM